MPPRSRCGGLFSTVRRWPVWTTTCCCPPQHSLGDGASECCGGQQHVVVQTGQRRTVEKSPPHLERGGIEGAIGAVADLVGRGYVCEGVLAYQSQDRAMWNH